ncbi:MAG: uroporphyrinogen decarboxylase family protein [Candidatus Brocadiia bacterium]
MNPKERVLTTIAHEEPDRVPIDYSANPGIDGRLKEHFGLEPDDAEGLRQVLNVDFRYVGAPYAGPELHPPVEGRRINMWGVRKRWVEHESGGYWDYCDFPLKNATLEEIKVWPMPSPDDFDYSNVKNACKEYSDYCVMVGGAGTGDIINSTGMIRTMQQVMIDIALESPEFFAFIDRKIDIQIEVLRRTIEAAEGGIDVLFMGEDLGTQKGPMISLEMYRNIFRPRHQKFVDLAKSFDLPVMIHSCGSSSWAFDDFIEMGIDVIDTLQPEAADMEPAYLKETYGDRLAFHGMISTAGSVAFGTTTDVREHVRETLEIMKPAGGYCLAPTHQLQDNSPTENVVEMYEAAREYGQY